jgi:IPT/TIG domain-containing protein
MSGFSHAFRTYWRREPIMSKRPGAVVRLAIHIVAVAVLSGALVACDKVPTAPDQPTQTQPGPQPAQAPVTITGISRNVGSTGGGASVTIAGSGFTSFVTVTFGDTGVHAVFDPRYPSTMFLETPAHAAEIVDVIVTNPAGQSDRLTGGYTYVSPDAFDLNGLWTGGTFDGSDRGMGFTIQNNNLISVSCFSEFSSPSSLTLPTLSAVSNGAFAVTGNDGLSITGRIVSVGEVIGTMTMGGCTNMAWRAGKPAAGGVASR